MQLNAILLSLFAAAASAAPTGSSCPAPERKFGIMALRSASPIHFAPASASQGKLGFNFPASKIDAQCTDGKTRTDAIFTIKDGELYLYGKDQVQQIYVDRSGMGQGVLGYFNKGVENPPRNGELKGWAVDSEDNLTFSGTTLQACPGADNAWHIWLSGVSKPAGAEGCLGFTARVVTKSDAVQCTYSTFNAGTAA
ncbi:hypothetical protein C8A03DRAFT_19599 [Achaetomium macrosporum]|uniref:Cell wall protein PhiA n=1 Tax=Achaetomium macrosporum TaxID=79813 RepID=A0AAN7C1F5_9PEZI|nr:hypothetical protein C8A03DRAFT_19599 [Achaetomium macrosporum]